MIRIGLLLSLVITTHAAEPERVYPVKMTASAAKPDAEGKQVVQVILHVEDEWSIFGNPVGAEDLAFAQTTLKVASRQPVQILAVTYPQGEVIKDKVIGDYTIYKGKSTLTAIIQRAKGDTDPLEISVRVHPVNLAKQICTHLPTILKQRIP